LHDKNNQAFEVSEKGKIYVQVWPFRRGHQWHLTVKFRAKRSIRGLGVKVAYADHIHFSHFGKFFSKFKL
jgi:hypothetical protein